MKLTLRLQTFVGRGANVLVEYGHLLIGFSALFGSCPHLVYASALPYQIVKQANYIAGWMDRKEFAFHSAFKICGRFFTRGGGTVKEKRTALSVRINQRRRCWAVLLRNMPKIEWLEKGDESV